MDNDMDKSLVIFTAARAVTAAALLAKITRVRSGPVPADEEPVEHEFPRPEAPPADIPALRKEHIERAQSRVCREIMTLLAPEGILQHWIKIDGSQAEMSSETNDRVNRDLDRALQLAKEWLVGADAADAQTVVDRAQREIKRRAPIYWPLVRTVAALIADERVVWNREVDVRAIYAMMDLAPELRAAPDFLAHLPFDEERVLKDEFGEFLTP